MNNLCWRCKSEVAMFDCPKGLCAGCVSHFEIRATVHNICKWLYYFVLVVLVTGAIMENAVIACTAVVFEIIIALLGWYTRDD